MSDLTMLTVASTNYNIYNFLGIEMFNKKPKKGIQFLQERSLIGE